MTTQRKYGIDLIKSLGIILVLMVHGLTSAQLVPQPINSAATGLGILLRIISMICIPLFIISMGYLNHRYVFSEQYLNRIKPIVISYFLAISLSLLAEVVLAGKNLSMSAVISEFFNLNVSNYAWYARMYFMFFLLIPFLNRWFSSLVKHKETRSLLIVLTIISGVPAFFNPLFAELGYNLSFPAYFVQLYPILYYFIGIYIYTFPVKLKKSLLIGASLLVVSFQFLVFAVRFNNGVPNIGMFGSYGSLLNIVLAASVFLLLKDVEIHNSFFKKGLVFLSKNTFDIYLISHIFDRRIYPIFNIKIDSLNGRMYFLFLPILFTLLCSLIYVFVKNIILKRDSRPSVRYTEIRKERM